MTALSVEDYLAAEDRSDIRHEYIAGQIYAMTGTSVRHNQIIGRLFRKISGIAEEKNCDVFFSDVKVHLNIAGADIFYYPDLMVCCDPTDNHDYYRRNPCLIVEVLSNSTARTDQQEKRLAYTQIESLQCYLLLAQDKPEATLYRREQHHWQAEQYQAKDSFTLPCIDTPIVLADCYP